jgi:hypothetical protein
MCIYNFFDNKLGCKTSTSARWGVYTIIFTASFSFLAFATAFYAVYYAGRPAGGTVVFTSGWFIASIVFGVIGIGLLILTVCYGVHLYRSSTLEDRTNRNIVALREENRSGFSTLAQLVDNTNQILRLVRSIWERDERKKPE